MPLPSGRHGLSARCRVPRGGCTHGFTADSSKFTSSASRFITDSITRKGKIKRRKKLQKKKKSLKNIHHKKEITRRGMEERAPHRHPQPRSSPGKGAAATRRTGWTWWSTGAPPPSDCPTISIFTSRSELLPLLADATVRCSQRT